MYTIEELNAQRNASRYDIPAAAIQEFGAETIERAIADAAKVDKARQVSTLRNAVAAMWRRLMQVMLSQSAMKPSAR
jgi:hypothetical protein